MKRFEVDLFNFFNERQGETHDLIQKDPKYQEVLKRHEEVLQEIEKLAGKKLMLWVPLMKQVRNKTIL